MFATVFSLKNAGYTDSAAIDDPEKTYRAMVLTAEQYAWDPVFQIFGHTVSAFDFSKSILSSKSEREEKAKIESYPVETENDILNLKLPNPQKAGRIPKAMEFSKLQQKHEDWVWFYSRSPFTMAANICGLNQFLRWMKTKPELCEELMDKSLNHICNVLKYWIDTFGSAKIFVLMSSPGESSEEISSKQFKKYALPFHVEYHNRLQAMGIKHFGIHLCGDQNRNLPYFAEISPWPHPSVLSFGPEVDIDLASQYFPEDIIFGNVDLNIIHTGTCNQVYNLSKTAIEKGRKAPGGFILGPGCHISSAPPANVFAMTKAVDDYGWY